jgi:hypothetical protein
MAVQYKVIGFFRWEKVPCWKDPKLAPDKRPKLAPDKRPKLAPDKRPVHVDRT